MGFMGQLKFALLCIDFLAWPAIALGYPLFASIRAIETSSKYHTRKLVIYWTLFSSISLFEYAFIKIIEWVLFWSAIKLMAIFWLVVPRFHGANYAYHSFIRPCLVVNLQELISRFEEQRSANRETFIDVADKYIKENGFEGLEMLIANKRKCKEADNSQRENKFTEPDEKNDASKSKQLKESVAADLKDNGMSKASVSTEAKQAQTLMLSNSDTKEITTYAAAVTKGILPTPPTRTIPEIGKPVATPVTAPPRKWTCHLCKVTTTSESNMNDHLRGKNHKAMVESLKTSKLNAQGAGPAKSSGPGRDVGGVGGVSRHWCFACDVELVGSASLATHLNGKRHAANVISNGLS